MFKNTSKTKKSTINRDTLLIVQIFILILLIFLIIKQVENFKNSKNKKEGFVDNQDDTVKLHIDNEMYKKHIVRLGDLKGILNEEDIFTNNFTGKTLITYNLYKIRDDNVLEKTSNFFKSNMVTGITIDSGYSAILYEGNNFDNNKRSILIDGIGNTEIKLNDYKFVNKLSSIKVFLTDKKSDILKREANFNNQILLLSKLNNSGEISRINLPTEKMIMEEPIEYYYDKPIKPIYNIIIPGSASISGKQGIYRNINLELSNINKNIKIDPITTNKSYENDNELKNITHYKIIPNIPTLDTETALNILDKNKNELKMLKLELNNIKKEQIELNDETQNYQLRAVEQLSDSLIDKIKLLNDKFNFKLFKHK